MKKVLISSVLVLASCGSSSAPALKVDACDCLESSARTSKEFRDHAIAELANLNKWATALEQSDRGDVPVSDRAGTRDLALMSWSNVATWCHASVTVRDDMLKLVSRSGNDAMKRAADPLDDVQNVPCWAQIQLDDAIGGGDTKRRQITGDVSAWAGQATNEEQNLIEVCRKEVGSKRPSP
jgi:hypothetical protein